MKSMINRILFLILISFTSNILLAQITFKVSDVVIATDIIEEVPYRDALEARIGAKIESFDCSKKDSSLIPTYAHSFVAALHHCFADHRPMVISPDMIWLMICQGLAQHINIKSDSLRKLLVDFEGKKQIIVENKFTKGEIDNDWGGEFQKFADSIKKYVNEELYKFLIPEFSTTTKTEQFAYQITLMKTVETYFDYLSVTECGIPYIILEGKPKDWKKIFKKARELDKYGMKFWTKNLLPTLEEFVKTSKGKPNQKFWKSIYKYNSSCGNDGISGWILTLFPYFSTDYEKKTRVNYERLPSGHSKINLNWLYYTDIYKMEVYSGFIGISQNKKTKALKPVIDWVIRDANSNEVQEKRSAFYKTPISNGGFSEDEHWGEIEIVETLELKEEEDEDFIKENGIYLTVEELPKFPGGEKKLNKFIKTNINYFQVDAENDNNGKVFVKFCINKRGKVCKISILEEINPLLDNEAIKIISAMPKWEPGRINGKKVNTWYTLPIDFSLNKN